MFSTVPSSPSPLHEVDKEEDDTDIAETTPPSRTEATVGIASTTLSDDPGCWPSVLTSSMCCEILFSYSILLIFLSMQVSVQCYEYLLHFPLCVGS